MGYELFNSLSSLCPGEKPFYPPPGELDPPEHLHSSTEYQPFALDNSGVLYSDLFGQVIGEFPIDSDLSADWEFSLPVLESGGDLGGRPGENKLRGNLWSCALLAVTQNHQTIMGGICLS